MFKINKICSIISPQKFESLNNGIWYYNFDIESETVLEPIIGDEDLQETTKYTYGQVRISGKPTINKCYNAVLKAYTNEENVTLADILISPIKTIEDEQFSQDLYQQIEVDFGIREQLTELELAKKKITKAIDDYDISLEVNSFYLNGIQVWLDKSTRVGLMNSITIERSIGKETSTLWFGNIKIDVDIDKAIQMLSALEIYALNCYNKTSEHKVIVNGIDSIEEVYNYNFTEGYPEKLNFNI